MKAYSSSPFIFCSLLIFCVVACKKPDNGMDGGIINPDRDLNMILMQNQFVLWPKSECSFYVETVDAGEGKYTFRGPIPFSWRVVSGPNTPIVQMEDGYSDKVKLFKMSGLTIGVYEFEASFDEKYSLKNNKSICRIIVDSLSNPPKEIIFPNQSWVVKGSMYQLSELEIKEIYKKIPPESLFKVFMKIGADWVALQPGYFGNGWYSYTFYYFKGEPPNDISTLTIWADGAATGKADIKLLY